MATSYTPLLGLALPVQGELSGTWGTTVNDNITSYLDAAVAGTQTLSTDADVTLTKTTGVTIGSTSAQYAIINCTGSRAALRTITVPATSKMYVVINATTGGLAVKIVGAGPTTGVTVANGTTAFIVWNGADFAPVSVVANTTGVAPVAYGGTGAATFTSGGILRGNGTGAISVASSADITTAIGTLGVAAGGTGVTTIASNALVVGAGTGAVTTIAPGANTNVLQSNGTTWASTALSTALGTVGVANGGTGATTLTANNVLLGNGTSAVQVVAPGTSGNVLTSNGTTWQSTAQTYTGIKSNQYTTTGSTTFTIPTGISSIKVTIVGAGGGAMTGAAAGGGGTAVKYLTGVTPGLTITVTVGAGGSAGSGTAGGSSSISSGTQTLSTVTANGGNGATSSTSATGGTCSGGDLNVTGGAGFIADAGGTVNALQRGGGTMMGLGNGLSYGSGGANSQAGANGLVFFEW